jgi:hypothetical protein
VIEWAIEDKKGSDMWSRKMTVTETRALTLNKISKLYKTETKMNVNTKII